MGNNNREFQETLYVNNQTYIDYLTRFKKIALSRFEWKLPETMNEIYLEKTLYYYGQAGFYKNNNYGFINCKLTSNGNLNLYGYPVRL